MNAPTLIKVKERLGQQLLDKGLMLSRHLLMVGSRHRSRPIGHEGGRLGGFVRGNNGGGGGQGDSGHELGQVVHYSVTPLRVDRFLGQQHLSAVKYISVI